MERSLLFALVSGSAYTDIKSGKILNSYTGIILAAGVVMTVIRDVSLLPERSLSAASILLIMLPVCLIGGMGAGDVKLLCVIAFFLGRDETVICSAVAFCLAVLSAPVILFLERLRKDPGEKIKIRFAVPVFVSVMMQLWKTAAV